MTQWQRWILGCAHIAEGLFIVATLGGVEPPHYSYDWVRYCNRAARRDVHG